MNQFIVNMIPTYIIYLPNYIYIKIIYAYYTYLPSMCCTSHSDFSLNWNGTCYISKSKHHAISTITPFNKHTISTFFTRILGIDFQLSTHVPIQCKIHTFLHTSRITAIWAVITQITRSHEILWW